MRISLWLFCQHLYSRSIFFIFYFLLLLRAPRDAANVVNSLSTKSNKKTLLVTYLVRLPHVPAFFASSLTQIAGHKMAALASCFRNLQMSICDKPDQKSTEKLMVFFFFSFFFSFFLFYFFKFHSKKSAYVLVLAVCLCTAHMSEMASSTAYLSVLIS